MLLCVLCFHSPVFILSGLFLFELNLIDIKHFFLIKMPTSGNNTDDVMQKGFSKLLYGQTV